MIGSVFLRQYQAISFLGKGAMGSVYLARHKVRPEVVVVKVMNREYVKDPSFKSFFDREIESLTQLRHPCIVSLYDSDFRDPNGPCLIMEFIPGITLEKLLERHKRLPLDQVNRLLIPLCRALTYGHGKQVTHRDLKPANLMVLDPDTNHESLKVMDFGLAQVAARPHIPLEKLKGVDPGNVCGTPIYMAPEGLRGDTIDHRADLYSVGVILFELIAGVPPFHYSDPMTVLSAHVHEPPPRLAHARPGLSVPHDVETLVRRCLEKYPNERPQSAREIAEAFSQAVGVRLTPEVFPEQVEAPAPRSSAAAGPEVLKDRHAISSTFDAWMPEPIAVMKLRGFVGDAGGEIVESEPGMIRVQFGEHPDHARGKPETRSLMGWLGTRAKATTLSKAPPDPIEMRLYMTRKGQSNCLELTVVLKPLDGLLLKYPLDWKPRCARLMNEMRAYLMAK